MASFKNKFGKKIPNFANVAFGGYGASANSNSGNSNCSPGHIHQIVATKNNLTGDAAVSKAVASVVVTICSGSSYDELFQKLPQESEFGRILVFFVEPGRMLNHIHRVLQGTPVASLENLSDAERTTLTDLKLGCDEAGPEAICFNFECCSGYGSQTLSGEREVVLYHVELVEFLVKEFGCMCMFSDFSLKAIISDWHEAKLGPNPFAKIGEFSGTLKLAFEPEVLKKSGSAQLATVGSLCDDGNGKGFATLHALGGTILYTITDNARLVAEDTFARSRNPDAAFLAPYELSVLTAVSVASNEQFTANKVTEIDGNQLLAAANVAGVRGPAGHVMVTYPPSQSSIERHQRELTEDQAERDRDIAAGKEVAPALPDDGPARGRILTSCGHWIELMKVDANMNRLMETVQNEWGGENAVYQNMAAQFDGLDEEATKQRVQASANEYVQSRAPAKFNKKLVKAKFKNDYMSQNQK